MLTKVKEFLKKRRKLLIGLLALVLAGVIAVVVFGGGGNTLPVQLPSTTVLAKSDLQQIVSGSGNVQSTGSRQVTSSAAYQITDVLVEVGDVVTAGQELCLLDLTELQKSIRDTQQNIATMRAQDKLRLEQAERKLQEAIDQRAIDETRLNNDINNASNKLNQAAAEVNRLAPLEAQAAYEAQVKNNELAVAAAALALYYDKTLFDPVVSGRMPPAGGIPIPEPTDTPDYNIYLSVVDIYNNAKAAYDMAAGAHQALATQLSAATAAQQQAQAAYDTAVQMRDTTLRNGDLAIGNARDNVNTLKLADNTQAARTQLDAYKRQLENARITAPVSGTITSVGAQVGQTPGGSLAGAATSGSTALFVIESVDSLEVPALIPEYDMTQLSLGLKVEVTTDALDGEVWEGRVREISPKAADTNGNFLVTVEIVSPAGRLAIGMSTKMNIIVLSKDNVFAVPYDAVVTNGQGQQVVYVVDTSAPASGAPASGAPAPAPGSPAKSGPVDETALPRREIVVETGLETDYYIEIISDQLEEGMEVLNDPLGRNVAADNGPNMIMAGGPR